MKLTDEQYQKAKNAILLKPCPYCNSSAPKSIDQNTVDLISLDVDINTGQFDNENINASHSIKLTCKECGFISLFSARTLNVF